MIFNMSMTLRIYKIVIFLHQQDTCNCHVFKGRGWGPMSWSEYVTLLVS